MNYYLTKESEDLAKQLLIMTNQRDEAIKWIKQLTADFEMKGKRFYNTSGLNKFLKSIE